MRHDVRRGGQRYVVVYNGSQGRERPWCMS